MAKVNDPVAIKERADMRAQQLAGINARRYFEKFHGLHDILAVTRRRDGTYRSFQLDTIDRAAELLQTTPQYLLGVEEPAMTVFTPDGPRMRIALELLDQIAQGNMSPAQGRAALICKAYEIIGSFEEASPGAASTPEGKRFLLRWLAEFWASIKASEGT